MEQGRTEQILERLMDMIENGASVPLSTGKVMINKEEATFLLRELEELVKTELKMYREVTDRRGNRSKKRSRRNRLPGRAECKPYSRNETYVLYRFSLSYG